MNQAPFQKEISFPPCPVFLLRKGPMFVFILRSQNAVGLFELIGRQELQGLTITTTTTSPHTLLPEVQGHSR